MPGEGESRHITYMYKTVFFLSSAEYKQTFKHYKFIRTVAKLSCETFLAMTAEVD